MVCNWKIRSLRWFALRFLGWQRTATPWRLQIVNKWFHLLQLVSRGRKDEKMAVHSVDRPCASFGTKRMKRDSTDPGWGNIRTKEPLLLSERESDDNVPWITTLESDSFKHFYDIQSSGTKLWEATGMYHRNGSSEHPRGFLGLV